MNLDKMKALGEALANQFLSATAYRFAWSLPIPILLVVAVIIFLWLTVS